MMRRLCYFVVLLIGLLVVFVFILNLLVYLYSRQYMHGTVSDVPHAQVALIPGAAVSPEGELSGIFKDRVDKAIELYSANAVSKILVSGDNSTESYNEVNPVRLYLIAKNVPDEDVFLDHAGFDTYSSMYRARKVFGVSSVVVVTQSFHLPRAIFIARRLGIDARGLNADEGHILFRNYLRELFAVEKAVLDLLFYREPKYLGVPIPIDGDGRNYL